MSLRQLTIPWALRVLIQRPLTAAEELLEVLAQDGEPLVAGWARSLRGRVRDEHDLLAELERLDAHGGPVARALANSVQQAWRDFGGPPFHRSHSGEQAPLPLG